MKNLKKRLLKTRLLCAVLASIELANVGITSCAMMPSDLEAVSEESKARSVRVINTDEMEAMFSDDLFEYLKTKSTDDELRLYYQNGTLDKTRQDVKNFESLFDEVKSEFFAYVIGLAYEGGLEGFEKLPLEIRTEFFEFILKENYDLEPILLALPVREEVIHANDLKAFVDETCDIMTPRVAGLIFAKLHEGEDKKTDLLIAATVEDDVEKLLNISVAHNIEYGERTEMGRKLIEYAALIGSVKALKHLLLVGAEITENTKIYALIGGNFEIIRLIENASDGYNEVSDNECVLKRLISGNEKDILYWLKNHLEKIKDEDVFINWCMTGDISFFIDWLREICSEEEINRAIQAKDSSLRGELIKLFLAKGVDVNARNNKGWTALMSAADRGHKDIVETLLANGADWNAVSMDGWTALMMAANNGAIDIVKILLAKGVNVNAKDNSGITALMWAAYNGFTDIAEVLVANGADVNAVNKNGFTVLTLAAKEGHTDVIGILVANGADVNAMDNRSGTALMWAVENGNAELVEFLLEHGANVDAANLGGWKALAIAADRGFADLAKMLLENGADVNAINEGGWTALSLAAQRGYSDLIELLKANGATE